MKMASPFLSTAAVILTAAALAAVTTPAQAQSCASPVLPTSKATVIDTSTCKVIGSDGAETNQNEAKNNFCPTTATAGAPNPITIADMVALQTKVQQNKAIPFGNSDSHPLTSKAGPATNRAPLEKLGEGNQVVLQGFVKISRQEGAESVNCGKGVPDKPAYHDIHISIVAVAGDAECSGVVAEMIPRHRPAEWTADLVNSVGTKGLPVRVTGQLMFDSSHTPCQKGTPVKNDPSRASLWEVHPIYAFEVCPSGTCADGGWVKLEAWKP
jgi:hypothetical protein